MNGGLFYQQLNIKLPTFPGWIQIKGDTPSSPTLASNYKHESDAFYLFLGVEGNNDGIYIGIWSSTFVWEKLPGSTSDAFGVTVNPPHPREDARMHVVVKDIDGGLYHGTYDLNSWIFLGWNTISGSTLSPPVLIS
jgi:hypothetical protein